jgi:hypothetical protein
MRLLNDGMMRLLNDARWEVVTMLCTFAMRQSHHLQQIGQHRVVQQAGHGTRHANVVGRDRAAAGVTRDRDASQSRSQVRRTLGERQHRHHLRIARH